MPNRYFHHVAALACTSCAAFALLLTAFVPAVVARQQPQAAWNGAYRAAQAKRGEVLYAQNCAVCHRNDLAGSNRGPAIADPEFAGRWGRRPLGQLLEYLQTRMPLNSPGDFHSDELRVTERFIYVDKDTLDYRATIDDPKVYTRPWTIAIRNVRPPAGTEIFEYAGVEGDKDAAIATERAVGRESGAAK